MAINKVIVNGTTKVDLTADTANASKILSSYTAHIADGTQATGTALGSSYTLIDQMDVTVSTTSTTGTYQTAFFVDPQWWTSSSIIYVKIRDRAGPRNGYFLGTDCWFMNYQAANSSTSSVQQAVKLIHSVNSSGVYNIQASGGTTGYGVYANYIEHYDDYTQVDIYRRYSNSYSLTINGTYAVELYSLAYAPNGNPFNFSYT